MQYLIEEFIKKHAFTLAEVLIVIGIIGIVADMTIPTLKQRIDKTVYVTQLKKVYTTIAQSVQMTMATEEVSKASFSTAQCQEDAKCFENAGVWARKYFKVIGDYGANTPNCFAPMYKYLDKTDWDDISALSQFYKVGLADGTCLAIEQRSLYITNIFFDINGLKKPNILGRDAFFLSIYHDGRIAEIGEGGRYASTPEDRMAKCYTDSQENVYGAGCLTRIISDGWKMDY